MRNKHNDAWSEARRAAASARGAKAHKGVYYFSSRQTALAHAKEHGLPTDRIIEYGRGHAIQAGKSGNYFGPDDLDPK